MKNKRTSHFHGVVYFLSTKKRVVWCLITLIIAFLIMAVGCTREARYKVLTFFFEGVPPLDGAKEAVETKTTMDVNEVPEPAVAKEKPFSSKLEQRRSSRHEPLKDCGKCHIGKMASGDRGLIKPVPDLCYTCHTSRLAGGGYAHGPAAIGDCMLCHDPHRSKYVHLQKAPQPKLCYRCHLLEDMGTIVDHQDKLETICTNCHEPHSSSVKKLLKN